MSIQPYILTFHSHACISNAILIVITEYQVESTMITKACRHGNIQLDLILCMPLKHGIFKVVTAESTICWM